MLTLQITNGLLITLGAYLAAGLLFAVPFVRSGVGRIDPVAKEAGWRFRVLILPGTIALWPLLMMRLRRGHAQAPVERGPHRSGGEA